MGKQKLLMAVVIFLAVFLIGVVGFKIFGGPEWSFLDSLYMTAITMSTVGYEEALDLSTNPSARVFTVIFIFLCLGTIAFAVSSVTSFIVEGELKNILGRKRMQKEIAGLKEHYIVCGTGETAMSIIQELRLTKKKFVVVDQDRETLEKISSSGDILYIHGDPAEDDILIEAGIKRAKGIMPVLPTDEANLFVTITARFLNPQIRIVAKGIDLRSHQKMKKAGADAVISPTHIGGMRMVSEMVRPAVVTFLDMMLREREKVLRFEEVKVPAGSPLSGRTVGEAKFEEKSGALLVAVRPKGKPDFLFNPSPETVIQDEDILVFIASPDMIQKLEKLAE